MKILLEKDKKMHLVDHLLMILALTFIMLPLFVALITSITPTSEAYRAAFTWFPKSVTFQGFIDAFTIDTGAPNLLKAFFNTLWIYLPSTICGVMLSAAAAYAFAKIEFKLSKPLFAFLMSGLTLPNCMGTIASFLLFDTLGWVDTALPLIVPRMMGSIGIVFFLRQFYVGIPDDLIGAAKVDGLTDAGIFLRLMLPISKPALISQFILEFIVGFNDHLGPLLYLQNSELYPLTLTLSFFQEAYVQNWPMQMAGCIIAMVPLVILYLIAQKYLLKGIVISSGIKG